MIVNLTQAGITLLNSLGGHPFVVTEFQLGDAYNYVPATNDTNIHGTQVFQTTPTAPQTVDANTYVYTAVMDTSVGDFQYGEVGLRTQDGTLVALGAQSTLTGKIKDSATHPGNTIRVDVYLRIQGSTYTIWIDPTVSNNQYLVPVIQTVDQLPRPQDSTPNVFMIASGPGYDPSLAFTDRGLLWSFGEYNEIEPVTVTTATPTTIVVARDANTHLMVPAYIGQVVLQFTVANNPGLVGICRNVATAIESGTTLTISLVTPLTIVPSVGDTLMVYTRKLVASQPPPAYVLPPASAIVLGGIKVGSGLNIAGDGTLNTQALQPNVPGSPFYASASEPAAAVGVRSATFALPANTMIEQPLIQTYDASTGEQIEAPISSVAITSGQCVVSYSTSVSVAVTVVAMSRIKQIS